MAARSSDPSGAMTSSPNSRWIAANVSEPTATAWRASSSASITHAPSSRHTATTLTTRAALDQELDAIRRQGYALDAEEFVDGLACIAVPVRAPGERAVRCALALQAPSARVALAQLPGFLGRLNEAATALARTL